MSEITYQGIREMNGLYPYGRPYDNLFNAEHRDIMIERYGFTSAEVIKISDLLKS